LSRWLDHILSVRIGLLKRCVVVLLILALTSASQVVPSCAVQPCGMENGAAVDASHSSIDNPCKSIDGGCATATICCQISSTIVAAYVPGATPIDWGRIVYPDDVQSLVGRHLEPDLHPPTTRI
jgi:hypothetical protein